MQMVKIRPKTGSHKDVVRIESTSDVFIKTMGITHHWKKFVFSSVIVEIRLLRKGEYKPQDEPPEEGK